MFMFHAPECILSLCARLSAVVFIGFNTVPVFKVSIFCNNQLALSLVLIILFPILQLLARWIFTRTVFLRLFLHFRDCVFASFLSHSFFSVKYLAR